MSRTATAEYIGAKRRAYAAASPAKRRRLLDDVVETTGYSRKYANRLLTGYSLLCASVRTVSIAAFREQRFIDWH